MITALIFTLAAVTTTTRPEIVTKEPVTRGAQLLQALRQAEDDFASVQRDLGLVGAAPLSGLGTPNVAVRPKASRTSRTAAQKVAIKTRR